LCNEVELTGTPEALSLKGSPTESALIALVRAANVDVQALRAKYPLLATQRRAESRNYMSTLHATDGAGHLLAVKGRPSDVLALCAAYLQHGEVVPLTAAARTRIESDNERLADGALRVLGFAYRDQQSTADAAPAELVWLGLLGMEDPPREGVADVMTRFHRAGVRTVMITGDQSATAQAVARQVCIATDHATLEVIDATCLDGAAPQFLQTAARTADVFARVSPAHKLQIVKTLQDAGLVVAMTGDGVNDGPALRVADIGIAMGAVGSSPACEMADVILEDDELRTLIIAIEQGRTIYDNIRKAVRFIISTNLTEILYTFTCVASGLGEPLTPMQLLWINLATDVFPELALAAQPPEANVLARPPRDPARPMFTRADMLRLGTEGLVMTAGSLGAYLFTVRRAGPGALAGTVGFTAITFAQLFHAVSARSETHTIFDREHLAHNRQLPLALGGTALAQVAVSFLPGMRTLLGTVPMGPVEWGTAITGALAPFLVNESLKLMRRTESARKQNDETAAGLFVVA
jgi:Ca2+-transporting ATPase